MKIDRESVSLMITSRKFYCNAEIFFYMQFGVFGTSSSWSERTLAYFGRCCSVLLVSKYSLVPADGSLVEEISQKLQSSFFIKNEAYFFSGLR